MKEVLNYLNEDFYFLVVCEDKHHEHRLQGITARQQLFVFREFEKYKDYEKTEDGFKSFEVNTVNNILRYFNIKHDKINHKLTLSSISQSTASFLEVLKNEELKVFFQKPAFEGRVTTGSKHEDEIIQAMGFGLKFIEWATKGWLDEYSLNACYLMDRWEERNEASQEMQRLNHDMHVQMVVNAQTKKGSKKASRAYDKVLKNLKNIKGASVARKSLRERLQEELEKEEQMSSQELIKELEDENAES
jgi:hypothetical protein